MSSSSEINVSNEWMPGSCSSTQSSTLHFRKCYQMYTCFLFAANSWSWKCVDSYSLFKGCTSWVESFSIYSGFIKVHDSTGSCIVPFWSTHSTPYSLIHTALSSILKCFLFAIRHIHTGMDAPERNLGIISCIRILACRLGQLGIEPPTFCSADELLPPELQLRGHDSQKKHI